MYFFVLFLFLIILFNLEEKKERKLSQIFYSKIKAIFQLIKINCCFFFQILLFQFQENKKSYLNNEYFHYLSIDFKLKAII